MTSKARHTQHLQNILRSRYRANAKLFYINYNATNNLCFNLVSIRLMSTEKKNFFSAPRTKQRNRNYIFLFPLDKCSQGWCLSRPHSTSTLSLSLTLFLLTWSIVGLSRGNFQKYYVSYISFSQFNFFFLTIGFADLAQGFVLKT